MAMKCNKCGRIIPDVMLDGKSRYDCKNHKRIPDLEYNKGGRE